MNEKRIKKHHVAFVIATVAVLMAGTSALGTSFAANPNAGLESAKITPGQAATIGINYVGAQPSQLVTVDFDNQDGVYLYGVEIQKDGKEIDVKVDPKSGQVVNVESEPIGADETNDDTETNDNKSVSDGDGETNDGPTHANDGKTVSDGDGETDDDTDNDNIQEEN